MKSELAKQAVSIGLKLSVVFAHTLCKLHCLVLGENLLEKIAKAVQGITFVFTFFYFVFDFFVL